MSAPDFTAMQSPESEHSVLGGLLLVPDAFDRIGALTEADFFNESHRLIFRRIALLIAQRQPVDVVTVSEAMRSSGDLDRVGGFGYLAELAANVPGAGNIGRYAAAVIDKRQLRDLMAAAADIAELCSSNGGLSAADRIDAAQARLLALSDARQTDAGPKMIGEILPGVLEDIEARFDSGGEINGLPTGFTDIDQITNGLHDGDLIIIAGRPSMGKTALALNIAENVAVGGKSALVFSMEMGDKQLVERCLASIGQVSMKAIRNGRLDDGDFSQLSLATGRLGDVKLSIDQSPALSVSQMRGRARKVKRQHGLDLVVIDYLQLMGGLEASKTSRNDEISQITRGLKLLARELSVPVILLSQLSRKVEERPNKRPMLSDLRDSGAIEQDADVVAFVYRDDYYNPDSPYKGMAEVLIRKHRMGELGDVPMVFQGQYSRFRDIDRSAFAEASRAAAQKPKKQTSRGFSEL